MREVKRSNKNSKIKTGEIEIEVNTLNVLNGQATFYN